MSIVISKKRARFDYGEHAGMTNSIAYFFCGRFLPRDGIIFLIQTYWSPEHQ